MPLAIDRTAACRVDAKVVAELRDAGLGLRSFPESLGRDASVRMHRLLSDRIRCRHRSHRFQFVYRDFGSFVRGRPLTIDHPVTAHQLVIEPNNAF